jgi:hypothetical protein
MNPKLYLNEIKLLEDLRTRKFGRSSAKNRNPSSHNVNNNISILCNPVTNPSMARKFIVI